MISTGKEPDQASPGSREVADGGLEKGKQFLFLTGVPRSGTTAFAALLNLHPRIAIGIERFKTLAMSAPTTRFFQPDLFETARFFDFRPSDTNVRADDTYRRLRERYDDALWIGDKVPRYYTKLRAIFDRFPNPVVFYIVRDLAAVANSWNARARNENDRWPAQNDYTRAVGEWNSGNSIALRWVKHRPNNFYVVAYQDLFPDGTDIVDLIMTRLGLDDNPTFADAYAAFRQAERKPTAPTGVRVDDGQAEYLQANADMKTYLELLEYRMKK